MKILQRRGKGQAGARLKKGGKKETIMRKWKKTMEKNQFKLAITYLKLYKVRRNERQKLKHSNKNLS